MTGPEHYREAERLLEYGPHDEEELAGDRRMMRRAMTEPPF